MRSPLRWVALVGLLAIVGCGSATSSIPTAVSPTDAALVEQSQQQAAQEEMAQQSKR